MTDLLELKHRLDRIETMLSQALATRRQGPWVTASEAARIVGMPRTSFVRTFVDSGRVRSRKLTSGRLLIRRTDLEELA